MKKSIFLIAALIFILSVCIPDTTYAASSENFLSDYQANIYTSEDGLSSSEINAITQTKDGYIWAGGYSGLCRFNGSTFEAVSFDNKINNVMVLFTDSRGFLWVGTNDSGIFCYDRDYNFVCHFTTENGLASDSIRCITEDDKHNIYVGTTSYLSVISPDNTIFTYSAYSGITYVKSFAVSNSGIIAGVTNSGILFFLKDGYIMHSTSRIEQSSAYFTCVSQYAGDTFITGTSLGEIYTYTIDGKNSGAEYICTTDIGGINIIYYNPTSKGYLICAENGLGNVTRTGKYTNMCIEYFNNSISGSLIDYQGNIWFSSSKQGIVKLSSNPFSDIFKQAGLNNHVVNAVLKHNGYLYVGCDDGLIVLNATTYEPAEFEHLSLLSGVRIRHIMQDSKGNLWFSTYGADGLVCISPDNEATCYNEQTAGTMGSRFRSALELSDGTIIAASSTGITYIENGSVSATLNEIDGLQTTQILSLIERADGTILAGSDGGGIYVLKDKKLIDIIDADDGLDSLVILRIVKCTDGYLYVTSSSIYYDNLSTITRLNYFPYSNNYDIYITRNRNVWVSGSAGIYVVREKDMLANTGAYTYVLLDHLRGLDTTLTANSWNYTDSSYDYFLCCSTGVKQISTLSSDEYINYNILISNISIDNNISIKAYNNTYLIPAEAKRIVIQPAILNYTLSNPKIHMYLKGFDDSGITCSQSELTEMTFTNLPQGKYEFHIEIINQHTGNVQRDVVFTIEKDAQFFEHTIFKIYLFIVIFFIIAFFTWLFTKSANLSVIKQQYEQIQIAKEEAINANLAKSQFLANMSHEIRTPINTIMGMNELILRENVSPDIRHHANNIHNASNSLLSIVNDILDFSKIESGKMNIIPQEYSSAVLITDLANMLQVRAKEKDLEAIINIDTSIPKQLLGDDVRIKQVILNLLSNAVKYTDTGSITFTIKSSPVDSDSTKIALYCEVSDTGIGIRKEDISKLFESFQRLDEKRNAKIQGTGLGLNITKELLFLMGSNLEVTSEYGKGSSFFFTLEQQIVNPEQIGMLNLSDDNNEFSVYVPKFTAPDAHILIIDDNTLNLSVAQGLLKDTLIRIDTGTSGKMCLDMIKETHYDVILLDHMMPEMDGIETLEHIKSDEHLCKDTPVIILTANAIVGAKEMYLEKGFVGYISKPIIPDDLENMLLKHIPESKISKINPADIAQKADTVKTADNQITNSHKTDDTNQNFSDDSLTAASSELLDTAAGLEYCGNMTDFYTEMLQMFVEQKEQKIDDITNALHEQNLKNYMIYVHGLKSTSRMLGANPLSEHAKELEAAAKREDIDYIISNNDMLINLYNQTVVVIQTYLSL